MSKSQQSENQPTIKYYCKCFSELKVYSTKKSGDALNQPILLLSVIDLITQGLIKDKHILISDELIDTFKKYWEVLGSGSFKGSDFALPFFHLKNQKGNFWHIKYSSKYGGGRPQSIPKLKDDIDYAILDEELFNLLQDRVSRKELIDTLVAAWFSSNENNLENILEIDKKFQDSTLETEILFESGSKPAPKWSFKKSLVREAFFRKEVVHLYDYRCAFCGLKVTKSLTQNIVDGAHIKPFSKFYDSRINNGISLCKNHHWAFDYGWFTVDEQYKIIVTNDLQEESPNAKPMKDFHGKKLLLPNSKQYFPDEKAIEWHRQNIFQA